jgi:hypothetical protein
MGRKELSLPIPIIKSVVSVMSLPLRNSGYRRKELSRINSLVARVFIVGRERASNLLFYYIVSIA